MILNIYFFQGNKKLKLMALYTIKQNSIYQILDDIQCTIGIQTILFAFISSFILIGANVQGIIATLFVIVITYINTSTYVQKENHNLSNDLEYLKKNIKTPVNGSSKFVIYPSIENYNSKLVDWIKNHEDDISTNTKWFIEEKMHGANGSISKNDNGDIVFNRRKGQLKEGDGFYGWEIIAPELEKYSQPIFEKYGNLTRIFGEFIGGTYMGEKGNKKFSKVQKEIEYSKDLKFIVFDIFDGEKFIDTTEARKSLREAGFIVSPIINEYNSLDDALKHNQYFKSIIPNLLGEVEHDDNNEAEGIIIRPEKNFFSGFHRAIFKKKTLRFSETRKGFNRLRNNPNEFLKVYITENRLNAVKSKLLQTATKNEIENEFINDIFSELEKQEIEINDKQFRKYIKNQLGFKFSTIIT